MVPGSPSNARLSRRAVLGGISVTLAGCATARQIPMLPARIEEGLSGYSAMYGPNDDEPFPIPALDLSALDEDLLRREVPFRGPYRPGTVVVNVAERRLYWVQPDGMALRYAVGVGRE